MIFLALFSFAAAFLLAQEEASTFFVPSLSSSPFSWPLYLGPQALALPQGLQGTSPLASLLTSDDRVHSGAVTFAVLASP